MGIDQLDARKETLNNVLSFSGNPQPLVIPSFQREYKWEGTRVLDLFKHTDPDDTSFGFIGTMVFVKDKGGSLEVVDGQQRLLSLIVVLCALRDFIYSLSQDMTSTGKDPTLAAKYRGISEKSIQEETIYRSDPLSEEALVRVTFHRPSFTYIRDSYLSCIPSDLKAEAPIEAEAKLFKKNYEVVMGHLRDKYSSDTNYQRLIELLRLRIKKLRSLVVNAIYINNPDYATEVFETINATGITLRLPDLVKNFLYKSIKSEAVENDWAQIVSNCGGRDAEVERLIKYVWGIQFDTTENEIFRSIRKEVDNPQVFMGRLLKASKVFNFLQHPSTLNYSHAGLVSSDPANYKTDVVTIAENVAVFKTIQYARLILAVKFYGQDCMRIQDWVRLFKFIEAFQVRAFLTKEAQTSRIEKLYGAFSRKLYQIHVDSRKQDYKQSRVKGLLFEELPKEMLKIVPDDEFYIAFTNFRRSVSSTKEAKITKYLFARIEKKLSRNEIDIDYRNKATTLEEVLPQSFAS
ncbi:MAG TPA: DUF262 domain-containing protein, partial [Candidatus Saccharimonadales bacterium]|nr:DUF262 domain-containing protein [Candidatus Saccharimonadales bacterium]